MDIGHVVWVLIFLILLLVFCNGYMGEYMVAVVWIWTTTAQNITVKKINLTIKPLVHSLLSVSFFCVYDYVCVRNSLCDLAAVVAVASPINYTMSIYIIEQVRAATWEKGATMERIGKLEVRGRSRGGLRGGWEAGLGALGMMVPVAQVSFEQIPESRHT